ncbi:helix-turn-helix domain-containing protein [Cohnella sp. 56]|uniref:helix-turn-helix domain-containing protein n=1 Tax=Cohnella sp. 56 TaxID=3113722 RepID=UPI0030E8A281
MEERNGFRLVWAPEETGVSRFMFVPPRTRIDLGAGKFVSVIFESPLLAASESVRALTSPLTVDASPYAQSLFALIGSLRRDAFSDLYQARIAVMIAGLLPELIEQLKSAPPAADSPAPQPAKSGRPIVLINARPVIYAVRFMKRNMGNPQLSLNDIAHTIGYHPNYFCQEFSRIFSQSPIRFLNELRLDRTLRLLEHTDHTLKEICRGVGVADSSRLCSMVKTATGMTPMAFRRSCRHGGVSGEGEASWQKFYS